MHPLQLAAQKIAHSVGLGVVVGDALLALFEEILVVALINVYLPVVELHHGIADPVEEVTVVCHHKKGAARALQVILEVFDGVDVKVVGRLVQDEEVSFGGQHLGDCDAFYFTS